VLVKIIMGICFFFFGGALPVTLYSPSSSLSTRWFFMDVVMQLGFNSKELMAIN